MVFAILNKRHSAVKAMARLGVGALALAVATGAEAQAQNQSDQPSQRASTRGDDIIVTANKRDEKLSSIAGAINVQTGAELDALNATGFRDYLGNLPSVVIQTNGAPGFGRVTIRGLSSATLGATTGTYIDDVPVGSTTMFAAGGFLTPDLNPADLDRIEVLKGPQGTLYGASGPGGLLKFVTKLPDTNNFSVNAEQEVTTVKHGETGYALRASVNVPIADDTAGFRLSGFYRHEPGFLDNSVDGEKDVNDGTIKGINGNLLLKPSETLSIRIGGLAQDINVDGLNGVKVDPATLEPVTGKYDASFLVPQFNRARLRLVSGTINYELTPSVSLVSATSYSNVRNHNRVDYSALAPGNLIEFAFNVETKKFTQEVRLASASNQSFEWMVGGFYTKENSDRISRFQALQANGDPDPNFPLIGEFIVDTVYEEIAAFGNATYYFAPEFDVTLGIRYAHNKQSITENERGLFGNPADPDTFIQTIGAKPKDGVMTYSAAARWRVGDDTMLFARASSGYRPGGPRSLPAGFPAPVGFTNEIQSEKLWSYEAGLRTSFVDNRVDLSASIYYIDWKSIQGFVYIDQANFIGVFGNAGDAVSKGFEMEVTTRPVDGLSLSGSLGYSKSTLQKADPTFGAVEGDTLPYAPRWTASLNAEYEHPISGDWNGFVGGNYRYMSKHYTSYESLSKVLPYASGLVLDGYGTLDLRLGARSSQFDVTLFAKNVTNKYSYTADTSGVEAAFVSVLQPRTIGISVSQKF